MKFSLNFVVLAFLFSPTCFGQYESTTQESSAEYHSWDSYDSSVDETTQESSAAEYHSWDSYNSDTYETSYGDNESSGMMEIFKMVMDTVKNLAKVDPNALLKFHPDNCKDENYAGADSQGNVEYGQSWSYAGSQYDAETDDIIQNQLCKLGEDEQWLVHSMVQDQLALVKKLVKYSEGMVSDVMDDLCKDEVEGEESLLCVLAKGLENSITGIESASGTTCSLFDLAQIISDPQMYFDHFGIDIKKCSDANQIPPTDANGEPLFLCEEINTYKKTVDAFTALMDSLKEDGIPSLFNKGTECSVQDASDYCKVKRLLDSTMDAVESVEKWADVDVTGEMHSILKTITNDMDCFDPKNYAFCDSDLHKLVKDTVNTVENLAGQLTNDNGDFSIMSSVETIVKEIESVNKYAVFGEAIFEIISDPSMLKKMLIYQSPRQFCDYANEVGFLICSTKMDPKLKEDVMEMIELVWNPTISQTVGALVDVATKPEAMGRVLQDTSLEFCTNGESIPSSLDALCYLVRDRDYNELIDFVVAAGSSINMMAPVICSGMEEYDRVVSLVKMILNDTVVDTLMELAQNEMECLMKDMSLGDIFDLGRFLPGDSTKSDHYVEKSEDESTDILPLIILILLIVAVLLLVLVLFMQYRLMKEIFRSRKMVAVANIHKEPKSVPNVYKSPDVDNIEKSIFMMNSDPLSVPRNLRQPSNMPPPPPVYNTPSPFPGSVDDSSVRSLDTSNTNASYTELIDNKAGER